MKGTGRNLVTYQVPPTTIHGAYQAQDIEGTRVSLMEDIHNAIEVQESSFNPRIAENNLLHFWHLEFEPNKIQEQLLNLGLTGLTSDPQGSKYPNVGGFRYLRALLFGYVDP